MPPIQFIAASAHGTWSAGTKKMSIATPAGVRAGDVLVYAIAMPDAEVVALPNGVVDLGSLTNGGVGPQFTMALREAVDGEIASRDFVLSGVPASGPPIAVCLAYRGIMLGQLLVVSASYAAFGVATTHIVAGSINLAFYSDLYLGLFYSKAVGANFAPQNGMTERFDYAPGGGVVGTFGAADVVYSTAGASGAREDTCSAAATGAAVAITLRSLPLAQAGDAALVPLPGAPGGIGLPMVGV